MEVKIGDKLRGGSLSLVILCPGLCQVDDVVFVAHQDIIGLHFINPLKLLVVEMFTF